jgi:hypothetical protein
VEKMEKTRIKKCFCAACKSSLAKNSRNIVEQIERDLWHDMLNGGTDF